MPNRQRSHENSQLKFAATMDFARKLRRLLAQKRMSQSDLARACWGEEEMTGGYFGARGRDRINKYVTGKALPDPDSLNDIAKALEVAPADLAPSVVGKALEREHPEVRLTMVAGHREAVHVSIDSVMPLNVAVQIIALINQTHTRGATEEEHAQLNDPERVFTPAQVKAMEEALAQERESIRASRETGNEYQARTPVAAELIDFAHQLDTRNGGVTSPGGGPAPASPSRHPGRRRARA